jgi:WD40 repeat protein
MNSENRDAKVIFGEALHLSVPAERAAYLDQACAGNLGLRQEVESLLSAHAQAGDFLAHTMPLPEPDVALEHPGSKIGRYKLLERIGEGGFGTVWMAEQEEPVRRRVALKIIKLGMDTREVVARFEAERQALAMMEHPNIARVFDGGATDTGRPYFVMELVKGVPITVYCDANQLSTRERLELFMQVCHAVQHAHQKGVIHRDLKPSNVLVTEQDDRPVPKVIDFGVAKATQARLTEKTLFTRFNQWIGTPAYMSPEQAGLGSLDVDTRSDIYSLGVLLYELLTGRTPFDTQKLLAAGYDAVMRTIREEDPPKPSARLSTLAQEELSAVAAQRGAEPAKLGRLVRGDLDWIVMKALEKDRTRRYETANAFARDVAAYLEQEPVSAAAPGVVYRARKFVGRNRLVVGFSTVLALTLVIGTIISTWQAWRANRYAREAELQRGTATNEAGRATVALAESERARKRELATAYANRVTLAYREWSNGDEAMAKRALDGCAPELRGWEWRHLQRLAGSAVWTVQARPLQTSESEFSSLSGGLSGVRVEFTSDGRQLAVFGTQFCPMLLDADTGAKVFEWTSSERRYAAFTSFSRDGRWLTVSGYQRTSFYDTKSAAERQESAGVQNRLLGPETQWLDITSEKDGQVQLTGVPVELFAVPDDNNHLQPAPWIAGAVSNRFDTAASFWGEQDGRLLLWVPRSNRVRESLRNSDALHVERVGNVFLLVTGRRVDDQFRLRVINLTTPGRDWESRLPLGAYPQRFRFGRVDDIPNLFVSCVALDRKSAGLFVIPLSETRTPEPVRHALDDGRINFHRIVEFTLPDATGPASLGPFFGIADLTCMAGGKALVTAGLDGKVRLWDVSSAQELAAFRGHSGAISAVAVSADGQLIASASRDGEIGMWRRTGNPAAIEVARLRSMITGSVPAFDAQHGLISGLLEDGSDHLIVDLSSRMARSVPDVQMVSSDGQRALFKVSRTQYGIIDIASGRQIATFPARAMRIGDRQVQSHFSGNLEWETFATSEQTIVFVKVAAGTKSAVRVTYDWKPGEHRSPDVILGLNHDATILAYRFDGNTIAIAHISHEAGTVTNVALIEAADFSGFLGKGLYAALVLKDLAHARVYNTQTGKIVAELPVPRRDAEVKINAARTMLYTVTPNTNVDPDAISIQARFQCPVTAHLWSADHGRLDIPLQALPFGLDLSPDGQRLACSFLAGGVTLINPENSEPLCSFDGYGYVLGFTIDGGRLLAASMDGRVLMYDGSPKEGRQAAIPLGRSFAESAAQAMAEEKIRKETEEDASSLKVRQILKEPLTAIAAASPTESRFAIIAEDGLVRLYDYEGKLQKTSRVPGTNVNCLAYSPDGKHLSLGLRTGGILGWNIARDAYEVFREQTNAVIKLGWLGPPQRIVWAKVNGSGGEVFDWPSGARIFGFDSWQVRREYQSWATSADGQVLAVVELRGRPRGVFVFDAATGNIRAELLGNSPLSVAFSRDGNLIAAGHAPSNITIWDWKEKRLLKQIEAHYNWVVALAFSPDGKLLLSGAGDSTARVWDTATGKELGRIRFPGGSTYVDSVGFSPDGKLVFAAARARVAIAEAPSVATNSRVLNK